jgi:hypothetical protein
MATTKKATKKKSKMKILAAKTAVSSFLDGELRPATVHVEFVNGLGTLTGTLFQNGTGSVIGHDSLNNSGNIVFNNAQSGDVIAINGLCTGSANISVDVATNPPTPVSFSEGNIHFGFDII